MPKISQDKEKTAEVVKLIQTSNVKLSTKLITKMILPHK